MQPLSEGKWWAYAALCELIGDFERAAKHIARIILSEIGVEEQSRILKKRPDGKYRSYFMEVHEHARARTYAHTHIHLSNCFQWGIFASLKVWPAKASLFGTVTHVSPCSDRSGT
jgi:hypothetical protein